MRSPKDILSRSVVAIAAAALLSATPALAATVGLQGSFWDTGAFSTIDDAVDYAENNDATATFLSTSVDYPRGSRNVTSSRNTTLQTFLAEDAATLSGAGDTRLVGSVFKFYGFLDLGTGPVNFRVGSDDGFRLIVDGNVVREQVRPRAFRNTDVTVNVSGPVEVTLYYFENYGRTGVEFFANNRIIDDSFVTVVPLPASASLALLGLAALGVATRRRS